MLVFFFYLSHHILSENIAILFVIYIFFFKLLQKKKLQNLYKHKCTKITKQFFLLFMFTYIYKQNNCAANILVFVLNKAEQFVKSGIYYIYYAKGCNYIKKSLKIIFHFQKIHRKAFDCCHYPLY